MTAAERLLALSKVTGAASALLLAIGSGVTAGEALVDYSGLSTNTAAIHLLTDVVSGGGIVHKKHKKRWIERDGKILVFESAKELELYIQSEIQIESEPVIEEVEFVEEVKPIAVIDKSDMKRLSKAYQYQQKLYYADQIGDISRIIQIYNELQQREEEDIELLLLA